MHLVCKGSNGPCRTLDRHITEWSSVQKVSRGADVFDNREILNEVSAVGNQFLNWDKTTKMFFVLIDNTRLRICLTYMQRMWLAVTLWHFYGVLFFRWHRMVYMKNIITICWCCMLYCCACNFFLQVLKLILSQFNSAYFCMIIGWFLLWFGEHTV